MHDINGVGTDGGGTEIPSPCRSLVDSTRQSCLVYMVWYGKCRFI